MYKKVVSIVIAAIMCFGLLCGCGLLDDIRVPSFEEKCKTTEDGFVYYVDSEIGLCIIKLPDSEDVEIPEYIDNQRVMQLGYFENIFMNSKEHYVDGNHVKSLTVHHKPNYEYVMFHNLERLIFVDILYCYANTDLDTLNVPNGIGRKPYLATPNVELIKGDKKINIEEFKIKEIKIPEYVVKIESGVFEGIKDVKIKTSYETQPEGWEDGWNGDCEVEWGVEL